MIQRKISNQFTKIKIKDFVKQTVTANPDLDAKQLTEDLEKFKIRKTKGELCDCGESIWIIGSALTGKGCFTCITGETDKTDDYEVE
jgi:hypothetical protein